MGTQQGSRRGRCGVAAPSPSDSVPYSHPAAVLQVLEIKRLNTAIAALRSEMNKYEEQLEDCRKFKEFLDSITPSGG